MDEQATKELKRAIQAATKIARDALRETPSMTEITVEYHGIKVTLKRGEDDEEDFDGM